MSFNTYPQNPFPPNSENAGGGGSSYELPTASAETLGGVKVGNGLSINSETGVLSNSNPTPYELPTASAETLGGVKVGSGLSINSETGALSNNNPTPLTAGDYVVIDNNKISVSTIKQGTLDLYSYEFVTTDASHTPKVKVIKKVNGETISETVYDEFQAANWLSFDDLIRFRYDASDSYKWKYQCLVRSNEHAKNAIVSWLWNETVDYTETFNVGASAITDLATKGDVSEITGDLSNLQTTNKTNLVSAINELVTTIANLSNT